MAVDLVDNNAFVQQIINKGIAEAGSRNTGELGKQDFLNLLILQLRYQDPLNPMEDKEFIAQMAQFSALEQMQAMNASNTAVKGFSMIGKYVAALLTDDASGRTETVEGHVESVIMNGSKTFVVVGGKQIPIENVYNVADGYNPLNSTLSAYTGLIGYLVRGAVFDISTGEVVGVNGEVVSLEKGAYEDYAMLNGVDALIVGINKNGDIIEDRTRLLEYLEGIDGKENPADRHIEVFIADENGKRVPVGATLRSFEYDPVFGTVKAVLDSVATPVASVASIQKAAAAAAANTENEDKGDADENGDGSTTGIGGVGGTDGDIADEDMADSDINDIADGDAAANGNSAVTGEAPDGATDEATDGSADGIPPSAGLPEGG